MRSNIIAALVASTTLNKIRVGEDLIVCGGG
jgi:hypothetical protein